MIDTRSRCSTAHRCRAPSHCAARFRSICSRRISSRRRSCRRPTRPISRASSAVASINLTTLAVPAMPFLNVSLGTQRRHRDHRTFRLRLLRRPSPTGPATDDSSRDTPPALKAFFGSGERVSSGSVVDSGAIADGAGEAATTDPVQKPSGSPVNYSGSLTGGTSWMLGESRLGVIATAGFEQQMAHARQHRAEPGQLRSLGDRQGLSPRRQREPRGDERPARSSVTSSVMATKLRLTQPLHSRHAEAHQPRGRAAEQSASGRGLPGPDHGLVRAAAA